MQKTYKCKNGHKFKKDEASTVVCPTCNEVAELVKWNNVGEFTGNSKSNGLYEELGSALSEIPGATTAVKVYAYSKVFSWIKK